TADKRHQYTGSQGDTPPDPPLVLHLLHPYIQRGAIQTVRRWDGWRVAAPGTMKQRDRHALGFGRVGLSEFIVLSAQGATPLSRLGNASQISLDVLIPADWSMSRRAPRARASTDCVAVTVCARCWATSCTDRPSMYLSSSALA